MKYIHYINELIKKTIDKSNYLVIFGQNIAAGSCLSGLTRGLKTNTQCMVINSPNVENTQLGVGFGLMLNGVSSIFFMKQQDFLLLGADHLVNTYNFVRQVNPNVSFTVFMIVVDKGYEGMQSSLNNCADFCSIARIPGYTINNKHDAERIIGEHLVSPGFRLIGVSQRLFPTEILTCDIDGIIKHDEGTIQYCRGKDITIVCFNFSFPQGLGLRNKLRERGLESSLFTVNYVTSPKWKSIIDDAKVTKNIIILDDSRSENLPCYYLLSQILSEYEIKNKIVIKRDFSEKWYHPDAQEFVVNYDAIIDKLMAGRILKRYSVGVNQRDKPNE